MSLSEAEVGAYDCPESVARSHLSIFALSVGSTSDNSTCWSALATPTAEFAASATVENTDSVLVAADADSATALAERADFAALDHKNSATSESIDMALTADPNESSTFVADSAMALATVDAGSCATPVD